MYDRRTAQQVERTFNIVWAFGLVLVALAFLIWVAMFPHAAHGQVKAKDVPIAGSGGTSTRTGSLSWPPTVPVIGSTLAMPAVGTIPSVVTVPAICSGCNILDWAIQADKVPAVNVCPSTEVLCRTPDTFTVHGTFEPTIEDFGTAVVGSPLTTVPESAFFAFDGSPAINIGTHSEPFITVSTGYASGVLLYGDHGSAVYKMSDNEYAHLAKLSDAYYEALEAVAERNGFARNTRISRRTARKALSVVGRYLMIDADHSGHGTAIYPLSDSEDENLLSLRLSYYAAIDTMAVRAGVKHHSINSWLTGGALSVRGRFLLIDMPDEDGLSESR